MKKLFLLSHSTQKIRRSVVFINYTLLLLALALLFYIAFRTFSFNLQWKSVWKYRRLLLLGFTNTIIISLFSLVLSVFFGLVIAIIQNSRVIPLRFFSKIYIEVIRGTPFLVQILIFYYVVANALGITNRYVGGIIILSVFSSAYVAEIFRASIQSVGKTQLETAMSVGFTNRQVFRYITLPQVMKQVLPPLAGQLVSLVKDSSLLSIISIREFTMAAREINSATYSTLEIYIPLAIGYLLLTFPISWLSKYLEKKYKYET